MIAKTAWLALAVIAASTLAGCGDTGQQAADPNAGVKWPPTIAASTPVALQYVCVVHNTGATNGDYQALYEVEAFNISTVPELATSISVVFTDHGQELPIGGDADFSITVLPGQSVATTQGMPSGLQEPGPDGGGWTVTQATDCQVVSTP